MFLPAVVTALQLVSFLFEGGILPDYFALPAPVLTAPAKITTAALRATMT
jgi:hypothetical protein